MDNLKSLIIGTLVAYVVWVILKQWEEIVSEISNLKEEMENLEERIWRLEQEDKKQLNEIITNSSISKLESGY